MTSPKPKTTEAFTRSAEVVGTGRGRETPVIVFATLTPDGNVDKYQGSLPIRGLPEDTVYAFRKNWVAEGTLPSSGLE